MRFIRRLLHREHAHVAHRYKDFVVEVCWCGDYFKHALGLGDYWADLMRKGRLETLVMLNMYDRRFSATTATPAVITVPKIADDKNAF